MVGDAEGSAARTRGLEEVADLAPRVGANVVVVFVRHVPATAMIAPGVAGAAVAQTLDEQEVEVRQEVLRLLGGTGFSWELVFRSASPRENILHVADETAAD